jgi:hypothetical protein
MLPTWVGAPGLSAVMAGGEVAWVGGSAKAANSRRPHVVIFASFHAVKAISAFAETARRV